MEIFDTAGEQNTARTLDLARDRASSLGIEHAIVATTRGRTGLAATRVLAGMKLVVVTHSTGFGAPGTQELEPGAREAMQAAGASVLTATHAFGGVGRAVRRKLHTYQTEEIIAQTLRVFGQGTKVAIEIALMAADAGLVPVDRDVISVAGTGLGADTVLVLEPAHAQDFFDLIVREIVCKPALR